MLVEYVNNSKKHPERQIRLLQKSIEEFGFISPILIDKDNNIIAGHGRVKAAKELGITEVPCVRVEGLTEDQRRAYIIADNKISEFGNWDKEIVASELASLDISKFEIDLTGFTIKDVEDIQLKPIKPYGDERQRTANTYNMNLLSRTERTDDFWQMPIIECDDYVPEQLIGFNYAKTSKDKKCGIHFFLDDYQFERVWNDPEKYLDILVDYECVLSPDFSLYTNMPMPMKIWNVYRSRQIGAFWQEYGIRVIPTISWAEPETYEFCFQGIPKGSIVAVSTIGVKEKEAAFKIWTDGMNEMIKVIQPKMILVYGGKLDFDYKGIPVKYYDNKVLESWRVEK